MEIPVLNNIILVILNSMKLKVYFVQEDTINKLKSVKISRVNPREVGGGKEQNIRNKV